MNVDSLMCRTVKSCSPDQTLADAAAIMWENDCGCVPVVDVNHCPVGMITDRDICMAAYLNGKPLQEMIVKDTMSRQVLSVRASDSIDAAERLMRGAQVRRLPVTQPSGMLVGILSLNDIAREAGRERTNRSPGVERDEVAVTLSAVCRPRSSVRSPPAAH
jgi:CBS domain-containing protein